MDISTAWWVAAGIAVGVELITGTFYLLMISLGLASGALAAIAGTSLTVQLIISAIIGGGSVMGQYYKRKIAQRNLNPAAEASMDVGETVYVEDWTPEGSTRVRYRGSTWEATLQAGQTAKSGSFIIAEIIGNRLILKQA